jgi:hypothetical protein
LSETLTVITTPVAGLSTALNLLDAAPGINFETDTEFRLRRLQELAANGLAALDAIQGGLVDLEDSTGAPLLTAASVFENVTDSTDGNGLPPHSIQALVLYPNAPVTATDFAVATEILKAKPAGIQTYGAQEVSVTDASGQEHAIYFDYPTGQWIWVQVTVVPSDTGYAGDAAVQQAIVNFANGLIPPFPGYGVGSVVYVGALYGPVLAVPGVVTISSLTICQTNVGAGAPSGGSYNAFNEAMTRTQIPLFDTSRIFVTP